MFNFFKKKKKPENFKEVVSSLERLENNLDKLSERLEGLEKESKTFVNNIGILRYNPFNDSGGDQSFSIAILNSKKDGIVVSSLYSREGNRVYAKPIKKGESEFSLSNEEREAIRRAKN